MMAEQRASYVATKNAQKVDPIPAFSKKTIRNTALQEHVVIGRGMVGDAAFFVLKVAALETVRRFSTAKCPVVWNGLQAMQVICIPPFKWIQRWAPFRGIGRGMQTLSRPLLLLSAASAFHCHSKQIEPSLDPNDSSTSQGVDSESSALQPCVNERIDEGAPEHLYLLKLYEELEKEGISIPKRINEKELFRFHTAANGDFSCFLASIKKTIAWRNTYYLLTEEELQKWSKLVFWHGCDRNYQPCLVVRLGLACTSLPNCERPRFAQAIVSQVEHGILHLVDEQNPRIAVLVDCEGLSPLRVPMHTLKSCANLFQDHFPNRLGCLFVVRLPSIVRMITHTFIKVLKPTTRQKLKIIGEPYKEILSEYLQALPIDIRGDCTCTHCFEAIDRIHRPHMVELINEITEFSDEEDMPPLLETNPQMINLNMYPESEQMIKRGIIAFLMLWTFAALIASMYES